MRSGASPWASYHQRSIGQSGGLAEWYQGAGWYILPRRDHQPGRSIGGSRLGSGGPSTSVRGNEDQSRGGFEEKEVVGQMGPVEADSLDGSGEQLEGEGRCCLQEAP